MERKIIIGRPYVEDNDGFCRLCADVAVGEWKYTCFFEVEKQYGNWLCQEYSDPFVLMILEYAMAVQMPVECECPMTDELYYNLTSYFIPVLSENTKTFHAVPINSEYVMVNEKYINTGGVGTGLSGGVDSFNTIFKYMDFPIPRYRLTHLFFLNNGAMGSIVYNETKEIFDKEKKYLQNIADELGIELVNINTNMMELYGRIPKHRANNNEGLKIAAAIYAMRGLVKYYYIASSMGINLFKFTDEDVGPFLPFTADIVSSISCRFYVGDLMDSRRIDKVKNIAGHKVAQKYLHTNTVRNCGKCTKCIRTQMELFSIGALDDFSETYDVEAFKKKMPWYFGKNLVSLEEWEFKTNQEIISELIQKRKFFLVMASLACGMFWFARNCCVGLAKRILPTGMQNTLRRILKKGKNDG